MDYLGTEEVLNDGFSTHLWSDWVRSEPKTCQDILFFITDDKEKQQIYNVEKL